MAEIEKLLAKRQLSCTRVFLQRLDHRGIFEAVTGPAQSERLRQHFGLSIKDDLAGEIAGDLLADPSSAVAPTLQILLSKLWDQEKARIWDVATGEEVRQLSGHTNGVNSAAYSPDGRFIVTASDDQTARIWIANIDDLLAEATRLVQRDPPALTPEERQRYGLE